MMAPDGRPGADPQRWQRVEAVFQAALDLEGEARELMLAETCGDDRALRDEVDSLLRAYVSADGMLGEAIGDTARSVMSGPEVNEGQQIGAYRILKKLARGGMGAVYLAERADGLYEAQVAIKVIRPEYASSESLWNRFRAEQRILATLNHPHIARMLDAGITDRRAPYVVMEYVDGVPLNRFCRKREMGLRERLELFRKVCGAVAYAHRNLVIHRDIKPPNILVAADGSPKLLDFGIAKLLDEDGEPAGLTRAGERLMTPEYASPETIRGEPATTLVDVFALGVVLYELLSGSHPFIRDKQTQWELEQTIVREDAPPPSAVGGPLAKARPHERADLDAIVAMAMRKDPAGRYASAEALSEDIRRYLAGEAVEAARNSRWYAFGKFVRRNKLAVGAGAALAVLLAGVAVGMSVLAARADRERLRAQQTAGFLRSLFETADPHLVPGRTPTARDMMDRGAERIRAEMAAQPEIQSELLDTMAVAYKNLGEYERSEAMHKAEIAAQRRAFGKDSPQESNTLRQLADMYRLRGNTAAAETALRRALEIQRNALPPNDPRLAHTLNNLGLVVQAQGKAAEASGLFEQAIAIARQDTDPKQAREILTMRSNLGQALGEEGKNDEARAVLREVLRERTQMLGPDHPQVARSMYRFAIHLRREKQLDEAEKLAREAAGQVGRVLGESHPDVFTYRNLVASLLLDKGRLAEAEAEFDAVVDGAARRFGAGHADVLYYGAHRARLWEATGRTREAEAAYRAAYDLFRQTSGEESPRARLAKAGLDRIQASRQ